MAQVTFIVQCLLHLESGENWDSLCVLKQQQHSSWIFMNNYVHVALIRIHKDNELLSRSRTVWVYSGVFSCVLGHGECSFVWSQLWTTEEGVIPRDMAWLVHLEWYNHQHNQPQLPSCFKTPGVCVCVCVCECVWVCVCVCVCVRERERVNEPYIDIVWISGHVSPVVVSHLFHQWIWPNKLSSCLVIQW